MTVQSTGRTQLFLIALVFLGPLALAAWLYFGGDSLQPQGRTNHGTLFQPMPNLADRLDADSPIHAHYDQSWLLLYANTASCDDECRNALYTLRQSRLMLGQDMDRVARVFLHGDTLTDTVFIADEHPGLITIEDDSMAALLNKKQPAELAAGGFFLIDPLGNLVMYFHPGLEPSDMVDDVKHLLRLSRIG